MARETTGLPILDENGNLLGYRGADKDVTGRTQADKRFRACRPAGLAGC